MPFKSEKQRRWMHANEPEMAARWEKEEKQNEEDNSGKKRLGEKKTMKITKRQLRKIVKEELTKQPSLTELFGTNWEEEAERTGDPPPITKVGDLRKIIKTLQSDKRSKEGAKGLADIGMGILADIVPGAGTALSVAQALHGMYKAPDDKKTNTALDKLNVDDEIGAIVDDTVEDNFLKAALDKLKDMSDDDPIPDINQELSNWIKGKYDARTVVGFEEGRTIKITKYQLRKLVNEDHPRPDDDYDPLDTDEFAPPTPEEDAEYDRGYDDGFNRYPQAEDGGLGYYAGYEEGENDAKDPDSEASREHAEEFGPGSPGMMGPPRREGKVRLTKRQLRRIIKEQMKLAGGMGNVPVPDPDLYDLGYDDGSAFEKPDRDWANNASYMKGYEDGQMERDGGRR